MLVDITPILGHNFETVLTSPVPNKSISGSVTKLNIPFPCHVRLYERLTGRLIAQTLTDSMGNYSFSYLNDGFEFTLMAHDHQRQYNAVVQDMVKPV